MKPSNVLTNLPRRPKIVSRRGRTIGKNTFAPRATLGLSKAGGYLLHVPKKANPSSKVCTPQGRKQSLVQEKPCFAGIKLLDRHGNIYLRRWYLLPRNRFFNIYLHNIKHPDPCRDLHSHPWSFVTLVLWGWYNEDTRTRCSITTYNRSVKWAGFRKGGRFGVFHRITHVAPRGVLSLVFTGKRQDQWGFLNKGEFINHAKGGSCAV